LPLKGPPTPPAAAAAPAPAGRDRWRWIERWTSETATAILLAIAALATAWSSYQASIWSGIQASQYTMSTELRTRARRAEDESVRNRFLDVALFTNWLAAHTDGNAKVAAIYEAHFRKEFRPAFRAWRAETPDLASTDLPFDRPEYRLQRQSDAMHYDAQASRALQDGQRANDVSDEYVFVTVILASVLFFAGAVRPLVTPHARGIMLAIAAVLCCWAVWRLVLAPVAR
jgi:hypothetical protein